MHWIFLPKKNRQMKAGQNIPISMNHPKVDINHGSKNSSHKYFYNSVDFPWCFNRKICRDLFIFQNADIISSFFSVNDDVLGICFYTCPYGIFVMGLFCTRWNLAKCRSCPQIRYCSCFYCKIYRSDLPVLFMITTFSCSNLLAIFRHEIFLLQIK